MKKTVNVFLVETEYHLLISSAIILGKFAGEDFSNIICYSSRSNRLSNGYNQSAIPADFVLLEGSVKDFVSGFFQLTKIRPERLFIFQENSSINIYLAHKLSKKGTIICLAQDGAKPYAIYKKNHELLSAIKDSFDSYKHLYKNKLFLPPIFPFEFYKYGSTPFIKELWLTYPESFHNRFSKKLKKIPDFSDQSILNKFKELFFFNEKQTLKTFDEIIFYVNQPIKDQIIIDKEIAFLNNLSEKFANHSSIFIKLHPLTKNETIKQYKQIGSLKLFKDEIPAELYILSLKNSVIISGWSTALHTNNTSCNYYYLHKFFKNGVPSQIISRSPSEHIQEIETIEEIVFP